MTSITDAMGNDHRHCDEQFAAAEAAVAAGNWDEGSQQLAQFLESMQRHFRVEEERIFPAFEVASGNSMGPTEVMRHEHQQMRQLFEQMVAGFGLRDADAFLGAADTLLILMQQHNAKEEQILYPMGDRMLAGQQQALLEGLAGD